jgi:phospholipase C
MSKIPAAPLTRRRLLKSAAQSASLAAAAALLPTNVRRLLAQGPPKSGSMKGIKHVVLLMQENRSFDHYYGTLAGVRGFGDPHALQQANGKNIFYQQDTQHPDGHLLPFHLNTRDNSGQKIPSTSHAWECQHEAWNGGKMDQWLPAHRKADGAKGPYCMGYYKREDIPFQFALAEAFTLCDSYHCSVMGPTGPNRMYWMTGTIDPEGTGGGPMLTNNHIEGGARWTTYAERLEKAGVSWKMYQHEPNGTFNMLHYFKQFQDADKNSPLYLKGMTACSEGQFEYDALHDQLPAVSWICPTAIASEHPAQMPADGAEFIASKIDAIAANPEVWAKTVFIINYDENDGLFDHVAPPVPPEGTPHEFVNGLPIGGGFRVPCIIVSPWTTGGYVCSQNFDHTSVLQFLEKFTGVREPNITDWRRKSFGDLTSAFRFSQARQKAPELPDTSAEKHLAKYAAAHLPLPAIPGADQTVPVQEKGWRKRTAPKKA